MAVDRFWPELMSRIGNGSVVPVIGPDAVLIGGEGELPRRLVDLVGERLVLDHFQDLIDGGSSDRPGTAAAAAVDVNDLLCRAVSEVGQQINQGDPDEFGKEYVHGAVRKLEDRRAGAAGSRPPSAVLRRLAEIGKFDLFVTTTFDTQLERALRLANPKLVTFAAQSGSGRAVQLDRVEAARKAGQADATFLLYLFGRAGPEREDAFAYSDAQFLHHMHQLILTGGQAGSPVGVLAERDLLFIGVSFPDWLARFLIQAARGDTPLWSRRSSNERTRLVREFVVNSGPVDPGLNTFLRLFTAGRTHTLQQPMTCDQFVAELSRRYRDERRGPVRALREEPPPPELPASAAAAAAAAADGAAAEVPRVFVSYCHEGGSADGGRAHVGRVRQLIEDLRTDGPPIDLVWDVEEEARSHGPPRGNWYNWSRRQIDESDLILIVGSATYFEMWRRQESTQEAGKGAAAEAAELSWEIDRNKSWLDRIKLAIVDPDDRRRAPAVLAGEAELVYGPHRAANLHRLNEWLHDRAAKLRERTAGERAAGELPGASA